MSQGLREPAATRRRSASTAPNIGGRGLFKHKKKRRGDRAVAEVRDAPRTDQIFFAQALHQPLTATLFFGNKVQGPLAAPLAPL